MDAVLTLILLGLGILLLVGIYFWDQRPSWLLQRIKQPTTRLDPFQSEVNHTIPTTTIVPDKNPAPMDDLPRFQAARDEPLPAIPPFSTTTTPTTPTTQPAVPPKILQLLIVAPDKPWSAEVVLEAAHLAELVYSPTQHYYQRLQGTAQQTLFCMASLAEPGILPNTLDPTFHTPGLVLFAVLPNPWDGIALFSDMVFTAERIASHLGAQVQGEDHKPLTKQAIQYTQDAILEHRRQMHLGHL